MTVLGKEMELEECVVEVGRIGIRAPSVSWRGKPGDHEFVRGLEDVEDQKTG